MKPIALLSSLLFLLAVSPVVLARDAFAGTWDVTVTPDEEAVRAQAKEFKDVLIYKGSQLESATLKKQGFEPATYEEDTRGGITATFKCEMRVARS